MKDNCFTTLCWFLPCINMNQPLVYICPLPFETPSHLPPHPASLGGHRAPVWVSRVIQQIPTDSFTCSMYFKSMSALWCRDLRSWKENTLPGNAVRVPLDFKWQLPPDWVPLLTRLMNLDHPEELGWGYRMEAGSERICFRPRQSPGVSFALQMPSCDCKWQMKSR